MPMASEIQILLGLITLAGVISGGIIAGRYAERKARLEATASPYEVLAARVTKLEERNTTLEQRIDVLESERDTDRAYIRAIVPWVDHHKPYAQYQPAIPPDWLTK